MTSAELLVELFGRIREAVHGAVEGLTPEQLAYRIDGNANSIAWLVWHLTRIQDDHVAGVAKLDQVWTSAGWFEEFGLPFNPKDHGYGHTSDDVAAVRVSSWELLTGYFDDVSRQSVRFLEGLTDDELDRIVDRSWDPPVALGVRLASVISDDLQHAGQAGFVRGIAERMSAE